MLEWIEGRTLCRRSTIGPLVAKKEGRQRVTRPEVPDSIEYRMEVLGQSKEGSWASKEVHEPADNDRTAR